MQIFASSQDPVESARNLDDLRLNKMILESAQLMCCGLTLNGLSECLPCRTGRWVNHPLSKWVGKSSENYNWLLRHFEALLEEFEFRRCKQHSYEQHREFFLCHKEFIATGELDSFVNCCGLMFKSNEYMANHTIHEAYQDCLRFKWQNDKREPKWTKRGEPSWR